MSSQAHCERTLCKAPQHSHDSAKREEKSLQAMIEFYRWLAHGSGKRSLREHYLQRNTSLLPIAVMKPEHVTMLLMISFTEILEGDCQPSVWLLFPSASSQQPGGLSQMLEERGHGLTNDLPLPHHESSREKNGWRVRNLWVVAEKAPHTHQLLPPSSLSAPRCASNAKCHFSSPCYVSAVCKHWQALARLMGPKAHQGPPVSTSAWCQESEPRAFRSSTAEIKGKSPVTTSITSQFPFIGPATAQGQKCHPMGRITS